MALIIKGDMPKACNWFDENGKHRFCMENAFCDCRLYTRDKRPSDCPILGEIPDKHGRIIDAGPLEELYDNLEADNGIYMEDAGETLQRILDAPTILEASK